MADDVLTIHAGELRADVGGVRHILRAGDAAAPEEPGVLTLAAALRDFRQEMRVILPAGLDRAVFPLLAGIGRLRGRPYGFHAGQK